MSTEYDVVSSSGHRMGPFDTLDAAIAHAQRYPTSTHLFIVRVTYDEWGDFEGECVWTNS